MSIYDSEYSNYDSNSESESETILRNQMIDEIRNAPYKTLLQIKKKLTKIHNNRRVKKILNQYNLKLYKVDSDGNCQFSSIALQIYENRKLNNIVREEITDYISEHIEEYINFNSDIEKWLRKMRKNGEWGDELTLIATAKCYNKNIIIYNKKSNTCIIYKPSGIGLYNLPTEFNKETDVFLIYNGYDHYNGVKMII